VVFFLLQLTLLLLTLFRLGFLLLLRLLLVLIIVPLRLGPLAHAVLLLLVVMLLVHARDRHVRHLHAHLRAGHATHVVAGHVRHAAQVVEPRQTAHARVGQPAQPRVELQVQRVVHHTHVRHHTRALRVRHRGVVIGRGGVLRKPLLVGVHVMLVVRIVLIVVLWCAHAHVEIGHLAHVVQLQWNTLSTLLLLLLLELLLLLHHMAIDHHAIQVVIISV